MTFEKFCKESSLQEKAFQFRKECSVADPGGGQKLYQRVPFQSKMANKIKIRLDHRAGGWGRIFTTGLTIIDNWIAFSTELLDWGCTFSDFWSKIVLQIYG